jgi:hypothetical protein
MDIRSYRSTKVSCWICEKISISLFFVLFLWKLQTCANLPWVVLQPVLPPPVLLAFVEMLMHVRVHLPQYLCKLCFFYRRRISGSSSLKNEWVVMFYFSEDLISNCTDMVLAVADVYMMLFCLILFNCSPFVLLLWLCKISDFGVLYLRPSLFGDVMWHRLVVSYLCVGTTCWSYLQEPSSPRRMTVLLDTWIWHQ